MRKVIFIAFYTYDDEGYTNFYAENIYYDSWRTDVTQDVPMLQTTGGDFSHLQAINFGTDVVEVGNINLHFLSCLELEVSFNLLEPSRQNLVSQQLILQKSIGIPNYVCQTPNLSINKSFIGP